MLVAYIVAVVLALFVALGIWRGWLREAGALAGLLLTWSVVLFLGALVIDVANRVVLIIAFTVDGGFDSRAPGALIEALRREAPLDPRHPAVVNGALYLLVVAATYYLTQRFTPKVESLRGRLLGGLVGLAEGYLVVYLTLRFVAPVLGLALPQWNALEVVSSVLERNLSTLLIVGVALGVGIALLSSSRLPGKSRGRGPTPRVRGRAGEAA